MAKTHKLTDVYVRSLKPKGKHYTVSDGGGLSLRIFPNGRKLWLVRKMSHGESISFTLGEYPTLTLANAREKAAAQCEHIQDGRSCVDIPTADTTLLGIFRAWLPTKKIRDSTAVRYQQYFNNFRSLHQTQITAITPLMARAALAKHIVAGEMAATHNALMVLSQLERYACGLGLIEAPKLQYVSATLATKPTEHLKSSPAEMLPEIFQQLSDYCKSDTRKNGIGLKTFARLKLSLFTLLRPNEVAHLQWSFIDHEHQCICVPAEIMKKNREHRVPITPQLQQLLDELKQDASGVYIINTRGNTPYRGSLSHWLKQIGLGKYLCAHGVRSMARTYFADQGFDFIASEYCLAHRVENVTQYTYQRSDYLEQRREIMGKWCAYVESCYLPYFHQA